MSEYNVEDDVKSWTLDELREANTMLIAKIATGRIISKIDAMTQSIFGGFVPDDHAINVSAMFGKSTVRKAADAYDGAEEADLCIGVPGCTQDHEAMTPVQYQVHVEGRVVFPSHED